MARDNRTTWEIKPTTTGQLRSMGFVEAPSEVKNKRVVVNVESRDKEGKTDLALSGRPPIVYFDIDTGSESVIERFKASGKEIYVYKMKIIKSDQEQAVHQRQWQELKDMATAAWGLPQGTVIFDTWGEAYELARLSILGRLEKVPPYLYGEVNREMKELTRLAFDSTMSTVFIHKMKPIYLNDKRTDNYELAGWGDITYNVQVNLRPFSEEDDKGNTVFKVLVRNCRPNARMANKVYELGKAGDMPDARRCTLEMLIDMMYAKPKKLNLDDDEDGEEKPKEKKSRKLVLEDD